jgi:putative flippase GtrA
MRETVVPNEMEEFSVVASHGELSPLSPAFAGVIEQAPAPVSAQSAPGYQLYPWDFANRLLEFVDLKTNGRAGLLQRVFTYLFFGGTAALVNLGVFYVMFYHVLTSLNPDVLRNTLSYIVASELSILANFIPNDRFTFNKLPGAQRPWIQRCLRFHMTCIVGSLLTYLIELGLSHFIPAILAEAAATLLVLIYNFSFHHLFTYRHVKHA